MADIRINALATTAASTASDDFVAVDGSANGTRKLNAYSPTFGGNLTVSGTGSFAGDVDVTKTSGNASSRVYATSTTGIAQADIKSGDGTTSSRYSRIVLRTDETSPQRWDVGLLASKDWVVQNNTLSGTTALTINAATNATTLSGNLTVSGTGTSSVAGALVAGTTSSDGTTQAKAQITGGLVVYGGAISNVPTSACIVIDQQSGGVARIMASGASTWSVPLCLNPYGGNLLLGTTTDSSNGKLQLATHTTSAGGIGLGTALSIYRSSDNSAWVDALSGNVQLVLARAGTANLAVLSDGSNVYASAVPAGMGLIFRTNGSTNVLTLDSSQNATFAGKITANGASVVSTLSASGTTVTGFDVTNSAAAAVNNATRVIFRNSSAFSGAFVSGEIKSVTPAANNTSNLVFSAYEKDNGLLTALTLTPSGTSVSAAFNGAISINNTVNTVSPTSPNRTITMVIGGTTYYIHAKTTND